MEERNINEIKKKLSDELVYNLRSDNDSIKNLIEGGYSVEEIFELITNYKEKSGADLVNCNSIIKRKVRSK